MRVLVTGAKGFLGKNLIAHFSECDSIEVVQYHLGSSEDDLPQILEKIDFIFHLAGANRPKNDEDFNKINYGLTATLCSVLRKNKKHVPIVFSSSIHAVSNNLYGNSKLSAEKELLAYSNDTGAPVYIFRLPQVFGKWCRPNYNSVVATFCHNITRGTAIRIDDPGHKLNLVYIDDVVRTFVDLLSSKKINDTSYYDISPIYPITVGQLANQLYAFKESRDSLITERVGEGIVRALYSTYVSYLPVEKFLYDIPKYEDSRGVFVEMLKTQDSGQFSFFTAPPGITRGGHYHHSKTEKFLVIRGSARFCFRHIVTNEQHELVTSGSVPQVVETVPGWSHDITNIGDEEMVVMLWANEIFDKDQPDTYSFPV